MGSDNQEVKISEQLASANDLFAETKSAMKASLAAINLSEEADRLPDFLLATHVLQQDPFDGSHTIQGEWRNERGKKLGEFQLRSDASLYVEIDIIAPNPKNTRWFVEAVTAWGRSGNVKAELRMLEAV